MKKGELNFMRQCRHCSAKSSKKYFFIDKGLSQDTNGEKIHEIVREDK